MPDARALSLVPQGSQKPVLRWTQLEQAFDHETYRDNAGRLRATALAEAAADTFDRLDWLDNPDHWIWDAAALVAGEASTP